MSEQTIIITAAGQIQFVWDDALAPLADLGRTTIARAGDVEPNPVGPGWIVDCRRVAGGVHGPYRLREEALEHERAVVTTKLMAGLVPERTEQ